MHLLSKVHPPKDGLPADQKHCTLDSESGIELHQEVQAETLRSI